MRARNLKPGFFKSEQVVKLKPLTRLLFAGLWCLSDRSGRVKDSPFQIKLDILPNDKCDVDQMLNELCSFGLIKRYEVSGIRVIWIIKFLEHQNPHWQEKESKLPIFTESCNSFGLLPISSKIGSTNEYNDSNNQSVLDKTRSKRDESGILNPSLLNHESVQPPVAPRKFVRPTPEEVTAYARSIGFNLDGRRFIDSNDAKGWVVGRNQTPMKDWKAVVRTWKSNDFDQGGCNGNKNSTPTILKEIRHG